MTQLNPLLNPRAWLYPTPRGLYCEPGDFYIDPAVAVNRAVITHGHGDHARPGHRSALATPETLAIMRARFQDMPDTAQQPLKYGESREDRRRRGEPGAGRPYPGLGAGRARAQGPAHRRLGRLQAPARSRPARRSSRCRATCSSPRRPSRLPVFHHPSDAGEIGKLLRSLETFPERTHLVGVYALGKCQRVIKLLRARGLRQARSGCMARWPSLCTLYQQHGVDLGDIAPGVRRRSSRPSRARSCSARPRRSPTAGRGASPSRSPAMASGWMGVRARARQRGAELPLIISDHADWAELTPDPEGRRRAQGLGHARPRGGAGPLCALDRHRGRGAASRRPRGRGRSADAGLRRLLDALSFQPARNAKLRLIEAYLRETPDPDRGWALAALTGGARLRQRPSRRCCAASARSRIGAGAVRTVLRLCRRPRRDPGADLGDRSPTPSRRPRSAKSSRPCSAPPRCRRRRSSKRWLDALDADRPLGAAEAADRRAARRRLGAARQAGARQHRRPAGRARSRRSGTALSPPYRPLFAWLRRTGRKPQHATRAAPSCRRCWPTRSSDAELDTLDPAALPRRMEMGRHPRAGRVVGRRQAALQPRRRRRVGAPSPTFSRRSTSTACSTASCWCGARRRSAPFNDLQQRLNRKTVTPKMLKEHPALVRALRLLWLEGEDLRALPFDERRARLEAWMARNAAAALRPLAAGAVHRLGAARRAARRRCAERRHRRADAEARRQRPIVAGRPKGPWFKWKRDPHAGRLRADVCPARPRQAQLVLFRLHLRLLARGDGGSASWCRSARPISASPTRSCAGSTNGCATTPPTASARCARSSRELVLEVAFDGIARSTRHKSGVAHALPAHQSHPDWDKPASEADTVDNLLRLVP